MMDQIDETQRKINRLMGINDEDFIKMNGKKSLDESVEGIDESFLHIANMMELSAADIQRYGPKDPETGQISEDEAFVHIANMMGLSAADIERYGPKDPFSESETKSVKLKA
jgi:hypothetical protein